MDSETEAKIKYIVAPSMPRRHARIVSVSDLIKLVEVWNEYPSYNHVAKHFNIGWDAAWKRVNALIDAGVEMKPTHPGMPRKSLAEMAAMESEGITIAKIAKKFGVHWMTAYRLIKRFRDPPKVRARVRNYRTIEIMDTPPELLTIYEANVAHLIDLKRAGYSPFRTELRVTRERTFFAPMLSHSGCSSPAGWE